MPNPDDLIQLDCTDDLIQAGISYVAHALVHPGGRSLNPSFDHLRAEVVDKAAELAFRRYLTDKDIPHDLIESLIFTQADSFDIAFGGRRCVVSGMLVCQREEINQVHKNPAVLLERQVYLREASRSGAHRDVDLYIFAFLTGLVTRSRQDLQKALNAGQPAHLLYPLPGDWATPPQWESLGSLALKGDIAEPVEVILSGQDRQRGFTQSNIEVPSRERVEVTADFHTLNVLGASALPDGPIGLSSPKVEDTLLVSPYQWGNVWVYGMRIYWMGYLSQGDFYRQAEAVSKAERLTSDPCLDEDVISIPASGLKPMNDLYVRAENWAQQAKGSD